MAGPSSWVDDSDMLEYLDTIDSDSDFNLESDTDDTSEAEEAHVPHPQLLILCLTLKRMTWTMKTTGKLCHLSNLSLFLYISKNCLDLSMCVFLILLLSSSQT
jgi:hypothetical protein